MTAVAGALGSVIGYVGAEVAEVSTFERLLWPQRFYNDLSPLTLITNLFFLPMGGPLHRAALETLDRIRENGLYRGSTRGHMLGTAFFEEKEVAYFNRSSGSGDERKVRNGFWLEVLRLVDQGRVRADGMRHASKSDLEGSTVPAMKRSVQLLFLLDITAEDGSEPSTPDLDITEEGVSIRTVVAIIASELSAVGCAIAAAVWLKTYWLTAFFCIPLVLKLLSVGVSVRRESVSITIPAPTTTSTATQPQTLDVDAKTSNDPKTTTQCSSNPLTTPTTPPELYEIISPSLGFTLLLGQPTHIQPFFRHYGHPLRLTPLDRAREIACILLVYVFVLYFPAGLLSLLWMSPNTQYLWLAYQVYAIIAMHASRLFGLGSSGRTEERIARVLQGCGTVRLRSGGVMVRARLMVEEVGSYDVGRQRVREIVERSGW